MRKISVVCLCLVQLFFFSAAMFGYEEGPSNSGNWVYGKVTYRSGSKCSDCCGIVLSMTWGGMSENGCTDRDGNYKIYVASQYVEAIYFKGTKVWEGSRDCQGGTRIDIIAN